MGCDEHLLVHKLRTASCFINELDFVAVDGCKIVGNIMYSKAVIKDEIGKEHQVMTFGPLSVLPEYQGKGIGSYLVNHSKKVAKEIGYNAIIIYGDPDYYSRFGFVPCDKFGIKTPQGKFHKALQVLELYEGALDGISGMFFENSVFHLNKDEVDEFDKLFPYKEKFETETQRLFQQIASSEY